MELLSIKESQKILRNSIKRNLAIEKTLLTQLTGIVGFMGEYYNLKIYVKQNFFQYFTNTTPRFYQYFVKTLPQRNLQYRAECEQSGVLAKEVGIYMKILPNLSKYVNAKLFADCYHVRQDILVLEDLSLNHTQIPPNEKMSVKSIKVILQNLAKLHAGSIAWERAEGFSIGERFKEHLFELLLTEKNLWFKAGVKGIIHLARKFSQFDQYFVTERLYDLLIQAERLVQASSQIRNVFCHRDTSVTNVFMYSNENSACFVDFGLATYCPPAIDVHFLLYLNLPREVLQQFYQEYVEYYYSALQNEFRNLNIPRDEISRSDFQKDCQRARLAALIICVLCLPVFKIPNDLIHKLRNENNAKFDYWMNVDRSELLDIAMAQNNLYKKEIFMIISEFLVYIKDNENIFH